MIEIINGELWQWDTGRQVKITPAEGKEITEVHFYNGVGVEGYVTELFSDTVYIPDECLQSASGLFVYAAFVDESGRRTVEKETFGVKKRPKPPDYTVDDTMTYILVDEEGTEAVGVVVDELTVFDATANDIREGTTAATADGVTAGTKVIPSYHTSEGYRFIPKGKEFSLPTLVSLGRYDFTKFQAIICPFNGSIAKSVAAEKVAIDEGVYAVNSSDLLSSVIKDSETKSINLGIINESESLYLLRYFTYKEIY